MHHDTITLLLIQSQKNLHTSPSYDPIFPAERRLLSSNERPPLYINADPIATALACVDLTEICTSDGKLCYRDPGHPDPELGGHDEEVGYYMLLISLLESSTFDAIQLLGGRALVASSKLERQISLPLAQEQWKDEVGNLFEASLARPQIALRDYIRGRAAHDPEYADRRLAGMGDMCKSYKFPGQGWKSVSFWGLVLILCIAFVIFVLTREVRSALADSSRSQEAQDLNDTEENGHGREENRRTVLVAEWVLEKVYLLCSDSTGNGNGEDKAQCQLLRDDRESGRDLPFANRNSRPRSAPGSLETLNNAGFLASSNSSAKQDAGGRTNDTTARDETRN